MNNLLKGSFIAALMLILSGGLEQTFAQRCAGHLRYIIRNERGEIIDIEKVELKYIRRFMNDAPSPLPNNEGPRYEGGYDSVQPLDVKTECGLNLAEVALKYEGHTMLLRFHNIPPELAFFVDSVPFREGTYEIDFKSRYAENLRGVRLNRAGLRSKGGNICYAVLRNQACSFYRETGEECVPNKRAHLTTH